MKIIIAVIILFFSHISWSQTLTNVRVQQTTQDFITVSDSILMLSNPITTIRICTGYREFYFAKDSSHWTGYFIKKLNTSDLIIVYTDTIIKITPAQIDDKEGRTLYDTSIVRHEERPMQTAIVTFDADSLYDQLIKLGLYKVKQLTDENIKDLLVKNGQMKWAGGSSHPCEMTINISGKKKITVSYSDRFFDHKEYYIVNSIKIFHEIEKHLETTFEKYNYH